MIWDVDVRAASRTTHVASTSTSRFASDARRLVLFGPSGAGKTPDAEDDRRHRRAPDCRPRARSAGRTLFDGAAGHRLSPAATARLAYVFQDYALFPHLTVRQNIAFALHQRLAATRAAMPATRRSIAGSRLRSASRSRGITRTSSPAASASAPRWRARW